MASGGTPPPDPLTRFLTSLNAQSIVVAGRGSSMRRWGQGQCMLPRAGRAAFSRNPSAGLSLAKVHGGW